MQNALIFCNRKLDVDILHKSLVAQIQRGRAAWRYGQTVRFATLEKFKAGEIQLLVCSDVAARGLDIGGLSHVFNFDVPYPCRGLRPPHRPDRPRGLEGHAFTSPTPEDRAAVEAIEKLIGHPIPPVLLEGLDPVDWAEQTAGAGAAAGPPSPLARRRRGKSPPRDPARGRNKLPGAFAEPPSRSARPSRPAEGTPSHRARANKPGPRVTGISGIGAGESGPAATRISARRSSASGTRFRPSCW